MEVGKDEEGIDSSDVHVKDFYPEPSVVEHLLTKFDNKARLWDVVSP